MEINGAHNSGDKTKFENPEVFIALYCFGAKSEDIVLKLRLRAQAEMSLGQARQQKAENLKAAVEGAKLRNTMLETFQSKLLHNIGQGAKAQKLIDPAEIAIQTTSIAVFKEYIQKKITGMIEDEGKFEEYQRFCRMRQAELMEAGQLGKAGTNKASADLFKGESTDSSEDDEQDVSHGADQKKSKKAARFDFEHPSAFLFRNAHPTTGKRPDNFVIKNRERIAYGVQDDDKINHLKSQYRL